MTADNLFDVLADAAAAHGERAFMITGRRAEVMSFGAFAERADRFGRMLAGLGVKPGDRVAVWITNRVAWAVAAFGAARCGAVTVAVNTRLSAREVAHMLRLTEPRVLVMEANFLGKVQATDRIAPVLAELAESGTPAPLVIVRCDEGRRYPGTLDWDAALAAHGDTRLGPAAELVARSGDGGHPELAGVAGILSTSGTTGAPKGVMLTHAGLIREAFEIGIGMQLSPRERFYSVGPLFHCSGYMHGLICNLIAGSTYYTTPAYRAEETLAVLREERITVYHGFSVALQEAERVPGFDARKLALRRGWFGASASELARLERVYGARMSLLYGLTETGGCA